MALYRSPVVVVWSFKVVLTSKRIIGQLRWLAGSGRYVL